ncbi:hypothetical protein [Microbacterium sp. ZW T5_56]|uniref:hypothetical protein n=1 Tax=Microbacterium sp. ZW T5_56 TaxID=3378081 RepID=UPI0038541BD9
MSETPNSPSGDAAGEPVEDTNTGAELNTDAGAAEQDASSATDDDAAFAASVADELAAANAGVVPAAAPMPPAAPSSVVAAENVDAARAAATSEATSSAATSSAATSSDAGDTPSSESSDSGVSPEADVTPAVTPASFANEDAPDTVADPDTPTDGTAWNAAAAAAAATESARAAEEAADAAVAGTSAAVAETSADAATPAPSDASDVDRARAVAAAMNDDDDTPWYDRPEIVEAAASLPTAVTDAPTTVVDAPTTALTPPAAAAAATTPVAEPAATGVTAGPAQIFVQAPEEPAKRGNRGFSGVVGLLATIIFAVIYMAATLLPRGGDVLTSFEALGKAALTEVASPGFWIPVATFFLAFWLLGAILNTAKWGYWVVFGFLVGLLSLAGHILGQIIAANPWTITPTQALELARTSVFSIPGLVALAIGRELPVWFGGWIARRGRKVIAANAEAQEEFQRILDAGPQLAN